MNRRQFLATGGVLVVSFSLPARALAALPGDLEKTPMLDAWIGIGADGAVTVFTGKAELGQGIRTALLQIAAEQLGVEPSRITLVTADTARTPNEGYTAGSHSMQDSGTAILHAAAQVRERLAAGQPIHAKAEPESKLLAPRKWMGKAMQRVDIPGKVTGAPSYVQDLRLPGMVHARVVRPPSYGARLSAYDAAAASRIPGVLKVVRDGDYLAVIAEREWNAIRAMRALRDSARWQQDRKLPSQRDLYSLIAGLPAQDTVIHQQGSAAAPGRVIEAQYLRPYQLHGSIGPSCSVGLFKDGALTVWTHSQGVYPLREALAEMLGLPRERVRCVHMEGSGCYGHNAADDAAADAALLARAYPDKPVRVQWMREDEHAWEPFGPAMISKARATLTADGGIASWNYEVWSNTHSTRPAPAGNLAPAWHLARPFAPPAPRPIPQPEGGGDRNAIPLYALPNARVTHHFIPQMPLRVSALRALGAYMNVFSIESFMDELAQAARVDPVAFRQRYLLDPRARDVVRLAASRFGWDAFKREPGRGRGFAFARYKNLAAYAAIAMEVRVERETGDVRVIRAVSAVDGGEAVNPDGIRNQIEGGILQSISWTTMEAVTFDESRITSRDWGTYPILRFSHAPRSVEVHLIDRPGEPFLGIGEAAQGPSAAALANAVADAAGVRIRELPLSRERVKAAIGV
jgi:CO/xanthine dehydrogenase Mo-binding subunit